MEFGLSVTSVRNVCLPNRMLSIADRGNQVTLELDSHADTCCVGMNALVIHDYERPVSVYGYDKEHQTQDDGEEREGWVK